MGEHLMLMSSSPDDREQGRKLLEPLCPSMPSACSVLGHTQLTQAGSDHARAIKYLEQACAGHDQPACGTVGLLYVSGQGVKKDERRGASLLGSSCEAGYWPACGTLGQAYENGAGVPQGESRAVEMYERGCEGGGTAPNYYSCRQVGDLYFQGKYVKQDLERGRLLLQKACSGGDKQACSELGGP
jgi:TPR repeat protein